MEITVNGIQLAKDLATDKVNDILARDGIKPDEVSDKELEKEIQFWNDYYMKIILNYKINNPAYGTFIVLKDGTYISKDEYNKEKHEARGVLIYTEKLCHELDLFDLPEKMPWDEAVKHSIPSKEQWEEISNHREEIEEIIKLTGGDTLKGKWYWTSTEFSSYTSWLYYGFNGYLSNLIKFYSFRVRPFAAFSL